MHHRSRCSPSIANTTSSWSDPHLVDPLPNDMLLDSINRSISFDHPCSSHDKRRSSCTPWYSSQRALEWNRFFLLEYPSLEELFHPKIGWRVELAFEWHPIHTCWSCFHSIRLLHPSLLSCSWSDPTKVDKCCPICSILSNCPRFQVERTEGRACRDSGRK